MPHISDVILRDPRHLFVWRAAPNTPQLEVITGTRRAMLSDTALPVGHHLHVYTTSLPDVYVLTWHQLEPEYTAAFNLTLLERLEKHPPLHLV